jgi:hypothetical protein
MSNLLTNIDEAEVRALCVQNGLTEHETTAAIMFLQGNGAFPIVNYNNAVRQLVAEVSDRVKERNGELRGPLEPTRY